MNQLLIDGLIQHIVSFNDYIDYAKLIRVNRLFYQIINEYTNYTEYVKFLKEFGIYFNKDKFYFIKHVEKAV